MAIALFKVLEFATKFHRNHETGKKDKPVDWVLLSNPNGGNQTWHRVKDLVYDPEKFGGDDDESGRRVDMEQAFRGRWAVIEPKYRNWKQGEKLPEEGTALASWPFLNVDEVRAFQAAGIRTVEEVAGMNDAAMGRVAVPAIREKRKAARQLLENADKVEMQTQIEALQKQIAELKDISQNSEGEEYVSVPVTPGNKSTEDAPEEKAAPTPEEIIAQSTPSPDAPKRRGRPRKDAA